MPHYRKTKPFRSAAVDSAAKGVLLTLVGMCFQLKIFSSHMYIHVFDSSCLPLQDAGLETMAVEVGTVQGGQIAALQDSRDGGMGEGRALQ